MDIEKPNCIGCHHIHADNGNCTAVGGFCTAVPAAYCPLIPELLTRAESAEARAEAAEKKADNVRPVVRGRWENFRGKPRCSQCKAVWPEDYYDHNFCPRCGADMRGESGSEEKILHQI